MSGNMHGMSVGFLLGLAANSAKHLPSFDWLQPCLQARDIVYIGLRDVEEPERRFIHDLGIKAFTMQDVDRLGIGRVMEDTNSYLAGRDLHLSFDIDSLDPIWAPHTGTASRGGLTFREGNFVCESLSATGRQYLGPP